MSQMKMQRADKMLYLGLLNYTSCKLSTYNSVFPYVTQLYAVCLRCHETIGQKTLDAAEYTESTTTCVSALTLKCVLLLGHRRNGVVRGAHLCEDLVQPLQGPVQMYLNPAGGAGHVLAVVFGTPALRRGDINLSNSVNHSN